MISYIAILFVFIGFTAIAFAENPPYLEKYDFVTDDIVKIDDELFFISSPHRIVDDPNTMTTFHGINFTIPYNPNPPVPGGIRSSVITFPNGGTEKLSKGVSPDVETSFAKNFGLKAGLLRSGNSFFFLVSINSESPLKQIKSGIALIDVTCLDGKHPVYKYNRMRVACVTEETQSELWSRGWATMRFYTEENTSPHALCNNYEGKWHPENGGCRNISDYQCSLMGGEFVHDVSIYSAGTYSPKIVSMCVTMDAYENEDFIFYSLLMPGDSLAVNSSNPDFIETPYKIENGKLKQMKYDADASSLIMDIDSEYGGHLTMVIPFGIIDKIPKDAHLSIMVLVNGEEIDYQISEYISGARSIYIEFTEANPKIEIIGAWW